RRLGLDIEWLTGADARRREPHLRAGIPGAVLSLGDHQVENRDLARGLAAAVRHTGAVLHEHCAVRAVEISGAQARGVDTDRGFEAADIVVLAAGAWSRQIGGSPPAYLPPVRPI